MKQLTALLKLTLSTVLTRRFILTIIFIAIILTSIITLFADLSLNQNQRLITDFGLAATILSTIIISIVVTSNLVLTEQERGTIYLILPKPIKIHTFIIGKYLGLLLSATIIFFIIATIIFGYSSLNFNLPLLEITVTLITSLLEIAILIALATLIAAFSSPLLTTLLTTGLFLVGHSVPLIFSATERIGGITAILGKAIYYLLPNLEKFNLREMYLAATQLPAEFYLSTTLYAVIYIALSLLLATLAMKKREW